MNNWLIRLCLVLLLPLSGYGQLSMMISKDGKIAVKSAAFFVDTSASINVKDIYQQYSNKQFLPLNKNVYRTGYNKAMHWIGFDLMNNTNSVQQLMFIVGDPSIDELELFEKNGDSLYSLGITGDIFPFNQRTVMDKDFVYALTMQPNASNTFLLRINSHGHTNYTTWNIVTEPDFRHYSKRAYLLWGMMAGIMLLVILFSIFVYASLLERFYAIYALYVVVMLVWVLANNGIGFQYIWSNAPRVNNLIRFMSGAFSIVMMLVVMQNFLGQTKYNSRFYRFTNMVKWMLGLMVLLPLFPYNYNGKETLQSFFLLVADVLSLCCIVAVFGSTIEKIRQGVKAAIYYLLAVSVMAIGAVSFFLIRLELITANAVLLNLVYIGTLIEIVILTFGLTVRYHNYKKDREHILLEMQEQEKEAAVKLALAKEEERRRIAADMHDDLGAGLSGLKLMSELATRKTGADELKKETHRIATSASDLSEKMRDIIWTLNAENDTLQKLLFYIHHYGEQLFETAEIRFNMQLPTQIPACNISGDWRRHVFLAVKEAFNNIIKHAGASAVQCNVEIGSQQLTIEVNDNGKGLTGNSKGMGNGLGNMHQRMKEVGGKLEMVSSNGMSLVFKVPLPNP